MKHVKIIIMSVVLFGLLAVPSYASTVDADSYVTQVWNEYNSYYVRYNIKNVERGITAILSGLNGYESRISDSYIVFAPTEYDLIIVFLNPIKKMPTNTAISTFEHTISGFDMYRVSDTSISQVANFANGNVVRAAYYYSGNLNTYEINVSSVYQSNVNNQGNNNIQATMNSMTWKHYANLPVCFSKLLITPNYPSMQGAYYTSLPNTIVSTSIEQNDYFKYRTFETMQAITMMNTIAQQNSAKLDQIVDAINDLAQQGNTDVVNAINNFYTAMNNSYSQAVNPSLVPHVDPDTGEVIPGKIDTATNSLEEQAEIEKEYSEQLDVALEELAIEMEKINLVEYIPTFMAVNTQFQKLFVALGQNWQMYMMFILIMGTLISALAIGRGIARKAGGGGKSK